VIDELEPLRIGFLFGLLAGVPLTIVCQDARDAFRAWTRQLQRQRARFVRCSKTWECLDPDGHPEPCNNVKDID
jgi:hypothetical protein